MVDGPEGPGETAAAEVVPAPTGESAAAPEGVPAAPAGTSEPTGTADAITAARERIAAGESLVPAAAGDETPPEGDPPAEGDPPSAEGDPPPEGEETPPDPAAAEAEPETEPEPLVVTLIGLEDRGENQIEIEVADQETYERINRLNNGYMDAQALKTVQTENASKAADLIAVEDEISIDPTGFVLSRMSEDLRPEIAMQLLFEPTVLAAIKEKLAAGDDPTTLAEILEDPGALKITQADLKSARYETRETLRAHNEEQKAMRVNGEAIATEIDRLIPEAISGDQRKRLFEDCGRDVRERLKEIGGKTFDPRNVKLIVADRFRAQGLDLAAPPTPGTPAPAKAAAAAAGGQRTGTQFKEARTIKRAAAASAPAGSGAPAAKPRPELPRGTTETLKMAKTKGLRAMLGMD